MATKRPHGSIAPKTTTAAASGLSRMAKAKVKTRDLLAEGVVIPNNNKDEPPQPQAASAAKQDNTVNSKKDTSRVRKKKRKKAQQRQEALLKLAQDAQFTNSVILVRNKSNNNPSSSTVQNLMTCTTCSTPPTKSQLLSLQTQRKLQPDSSSAVQIYTQPLLVLDLNGILCHRIRPKDKDSKGTAKYRPASCFVAGTPVIPRPELASLLTTLDAHFCLAVWTSAQPKTAKKLVQELIPPEIASRLLFVWGQNRCKVANDNNGNIDTNNDDNETLFVKELDKVWKEYPLWNQYNTLLIDDSPDKCPFAKNALHPPPMNGHQRQGDEDNHTLQMTFFDKLATFWTHKHSLTCSWDELGDVTFQTQPAQPEAIWDFLGEHAKDHMGWRIE